MKIGSKRCNILYLVIILGLSFTISVTLGISATVKKVAILPLEMNSTQDLTFLQKGLFSMLSSRIADPGKVVILERGVIDNALLRAQSVSLTKGTLNESKAKIIGSGLGVDYILFGSVTIFGESVSLDISMVDINTAKSVLTVSRQAKEPGAVITELDKIAEEINFKVFGRETNEFYTRQATVSPSEREGEHYTSPLKKFQVLLKDKDKINGVATGDLDGDNQNEIVVIYDKSIQILENTSAGRVNVVQKIEDDIASMSIIGVDVADINQNGFAEIFITRVNNMQQSISSYIIEYDGSKYKIGKKEYPWYFKVIKHAKGNHDLFAQVHSMKGPWAPRAVFKVEWQNNSYVPGEKLKVPKKGFSLMSMTTGKALTDKDFMSLYTDKVGRLTLFNNSTGLVEWASEKGYGGSSLSYRFPKTVESLYDNRYEFFQPNSIVFDIDSDGKPELFVVKNIETTGYLFANTRIYKKGSIEIFNWNEMGLSFENAPKKLSGQVTNIAIGDFDNDSKMELLVAIIQKGTGILSRPADKSLLVAYDLD